MAAAAETDYSFMVPEYIEPPPDWEQYARKRLVSDNSDVIAQDISQIPPSIMSVSRLVVAPPVGRILDQNDIGFMPGTYCVALCRSRICKLLSMQESWISRPSNRKFESQMQIQTQLLQTFRAMLSNFDKEYQQYITQPDFVKLNLVGRTRKLKDPTLCKTKRLRLQEDSDDDSDRRKHKHHRHK